ncbi:hypothetical protein FQR65_LT14421 [Abscondita terminalis]|nr:hypothetical protein FQR65_LT14421 [Abscondita terminalis]
MGGYSNRCPKLPWMIDFHSSDEGKVLNSQYAAAFANSFRSYQASLNVKSKASNSRLTAVVCTFGSSINNEGTLQEMMDLGMTMIRLKMCHLSIETAEEALRTIRNANDSYSKKIGCLYPLPVALDIKGSEIRTGFLKDSTKQQITISQGEILHLTSNQEYEEHVTPAMIYVDYESIDQILEPHDTVYLNNGKIRLSVIEIEHKGVKCLVESTGELSSRSNVYLPGIPIKTRELTEKDIEEIRFGIDNKIDVLFIPNIRSKDPIIKLRDLLGEEGKTIQIIPKIDSFQALNRIDDIIEVADGILINRSALAVDMPMEKLFLAQKSIIAKCNKVGKPVICSSEILNSMITSGSRPTKSEICDISNAILDGVDSFLLSQETANGPDPLEALSILNNICKEAENAVYQKQVFQELLDHSLPPLEPLYALIVSAVQASLKCKAAAIIMTTTTGRCAKTVSMYRPRCPIIAVTRLSHAARLMHIYRGIEPLLYVNPVHKCWKNDIENRIQFGITWGKVTGIIRGGDALITLFSSQPGAGFVNTLRVIYASEYDTISS